MLSKFAEHLAFLLRFHLGEPEKLYAAIATLLEGVHILSSFVLLLTALYPIPYGRYSSGSLVSKSIDGKTLWRAFSVTWILPLFLIFVTPAKRLSNPYNILGLFLYILHYFQRSVIFPMKLENASPWPIDAAVMAILACTVNSLLQAVDLLNVHEVSSLGFVGVLGLILFFTGFIINVTHDNFLLQLRKSHKSGKQQVRQYVIPQKGLFSLVSAANYFGEIIEWWGLAMFTGSAAQILFAVTTSIILGVRGVQHHNYYKKKFGESYPSNRRAVIPFIL